MRRLSRFAGVMTAAALAVAGCSSSITAAGGEGSAGQEKVTITSPEDGATVRSPFVLRWSSTVPLGPPDSGRDHVHVYVDGHDSDYTVVGGTQFRIQDLSPGEHELDISLQHADHSPVGPKDSINVSVSGAGSTSGSPSTNGSDGGGYDY